MTDPEQPWRRTIEPNRALDPTYANPPPWFVGNGKGLMIGVLAVVAILIVARIASTGYLIAEGYRWWRAPVPTILPRNLPHAATSPMPIGRPVEWFDQDDYPVAALRTGEQGRVRVTLLVGNDGEPIGCEVTEPSGIAALDEGTCRAAVRHGRFTPGADDRGRPIEARYLMPRVVWRLPD